MKDSDFINIPWKDGGRSRDGCDCVGIVILFFREALGIELPTVETPVDDSEKNGLAEKAMAGQSKREEHLPPQRGDLLFYRRLTDGQIVHVAVALGDGRILHAARGGSRIENGNTLLARIGLMQCGRIPAHDTQRIATALADPRVRFDPGTWITIALVVLSIGAAVASYALAPKVPKIPQRSGRYSVDGLLTQASPEIPLADVHGSAVVAGNAVYTQQPDRNSDVTDASLQKFNKIVVLGSGSLDVDWRCCLKVNGLHWGDKHFYEAAFYNRGFKAFPAQTKAESVDGTIAGDSNVPSFTIWGGFDSIGRVPVDVRAAYDRNFPLYGFNGTSYAVFRLINGTKFNQFNLTARSTGPAVRKFNGTGFLTSALALSTTGAAVVEKRLALGAKPIKSVTSLTVAGNAWTAMSSTAQTGNVFWVNHTRGYVEFPANQPGGSDAIVVSGTYFQTEITSNPVAHLIDILTSTTRGKGLDETRINWDRAQGAYDDCASAGYFIGYVIDYRKPIHEHLKAMLDAGLIYMFLGDGKVVLKVRQNDDYVMDFDDATILVEDEKSTFRSQMVDRADRANRIRAFYQSDQTYNSETEYAVEDRDDQRKRQARLGNNGVSELALKFPAVTRPESVETLSGILLRENLSSLAKCEFKTAIQGIPLEPGDIIRVTQGSRPGWIQKLMRIEQIESDEEGHLAIQASEHVPSAYPF